MTIMSSFQAHQPTLLEMIKDPSMSPLLPNQRYQPPTAVIAPLISCLTITASTEWKEMLTISHLVLPDNVPFVYNKQNDVKSTLNQEECEMLNTAIGRLLNAGYLNEARQLATLFKHDSPDLTIVLCCIQLAQGKLSPDHLTQDVLDLLANCTPHRHTTSPFMSDENRVKNKTSLEIIRMLQQLSDRSGHAHKCCQSIISCFRIAVALHKSYNSVVANDVFNTLAELLSNLNPDKYTLAQLFVSSINMQPKEVAGFLKDCIYASLQCYIGGEEQEYSRVKVYEPQMSSGNFISLVQLCSDHTLLGSFLLSTAKRISKTEVSSAASLSMQVEMVIRSHDCYTLACSVDGIAEVLKLSREITESLYQGKHYKLMVRLLTGVGRFHEMSYIIQSLLYCDEFESLVHHGVEKVEQLRVALMDYLKKNYKHDHEKRQMVALKFGMYRELAKAREDQAIRDIRKLKNKSLGSDSIQILKRIFSDLRDASKIYVENNCLKSAENCSAQAKLVALQLSILQSGKQILNMDGKSVRKFMEEQPFMEALIVADAYKQTLLADWVSPLYKHVISSGDMRYLNEFKSVYTLSPSIVQELASRYLLDRNRSAEAPNNMKKLLAHCANLTLKHKLLHQLALQDDHNNINEGFLRDVAKL
jgi:spatacsin